MKEVYIDMTVDSDEYPFEMLWEDYEMTKDELCSLMNDEYDAFLVRGNVQLWNGVVSGYECCRYAEDVFAFCFNRDIYSESVQVGLNDDGELCFTGYHHDGGVYFEIRGLTSEQETNYEEWEYGYTEEDGEEYNPVAPDKLWEVASKIKPW